jgi:formyltetrahydrofolate deformylase
MTKDQSPRDGRVEDSTKRRRFILNFSCEDAPGIVADVSAYLFDSQCHILQLEQFNDGDRGRLFMRVAFVNECASLDQESLRSRFEVVVRRYGMQWTLRDTSSPKRAMLLVSKLDHCLADLLYRWRAGELPMEITAVVSNHPRGVLAHIDLAGVPYHYLPVSSDAKSVQEAALLDLIEKTDTELVVLARYMQVLSDALAARLSPRCINIHHSFLPGFKGGKPYHQAFARGVKLIGATAHFVTGDLDEGPIIDQDVERISHTDGVQDLIRKGREIECRVLARAVSAYLDDRIFVNGNKTVVFGR